MPYLTQAVLQAQLQLIFPWRIRKVRNPFAVGRPCWVAIGSCGCVRHVTDITFVGRYREDFTPGFHQCARSRRREVERMDAFRLHLHKPWPHLRKISRHTDIDCLSLMCAEVVEMKRSE